MADRSRCSASSANPDRCLCRRCWCGGCSCVTARWSAWKKSPKMSSLA
jgi:hypothetical protein